MKVIAALLLGAMSALAAPSAAALSQQLHQVELDPQESYRVRDLQLSKDEGRFFLSDGILSFFKPIAGRRLGAVFTADVEGGDAEILLIPPSRGERTSLAAFTKSPTLDEHFRAAVFLFTDDSAETLLKGIRGNEFNKKAEEEGFLLASRWNMAVRNLSASFEVRLIDDFLANRAEKEGFFFCAIAGRSLGNFDFIFDPRTRQQITVGQFASRNDRNYYDIWTHFTSRSFRGKERAEQLKIESFTIDARIDSGLHLSTTTKMRVVPSDSSPSIAFEISPQMKITAADVDGVPAEVFRPESLRSNLLRGDTNEAFLVIAPGPLEPRRPYQISIRHEGDVIHNAGNKVYFVGSRINWYPQRGTQFADYDLTFRFPKNLSLVASGELIDERVDGEETIAHRRSPVPMRFAGFNLGDYARSAVTRGGYKVEVYANRQLESALAQRPVAVQMPASAGYPRRRIPEPPAVISQPPLSPAANVERMAGLIAEELEWMAQRLGPPPQQTLAVSPIPGQFGQGFPGLLYLSTLSYLESFTSMNPSKETSVFFSELLHAHETAHQWWGNSVASSSYEDDWLQEALANYMSLMLLEKRNGTKTLDGVLNEYRDRLLRKDSDGRVAESAGPVTLGLRLQSSNTPGAWRTVVYDKGAWIIHMLRRRLGDDLFWSLLAETAKRYQRQSLSTGQFRDLAGEIATRQSLKDSYRAVDPKMESFFETWTQGTGIPALKLTWSIKGASPKVVLTGTVTQTEVPDEFSDVVPIEIQVARGKTITKWVRTESDPVTFTMTLPAAPLKVTLDPLNATLRR